MEASESPLSTSPSPPSSFSPQRHFYLAVDRLQFKMETLLRLLGMAGKHPCLPMVVCCSTRDELDAIVCQHRWFYDTHCPKQMETYTRRMTACLSADGLVISMVVGGEVVILKNLEENTGLVIAEMHINIFEMI